MLAPIFHAAFVHYYESVATPLLAAMGGRPVLLQRFPNGAGGSSFFQKRVGDKRPEWLETAIVSTRPALPVSVISVPQVPSSAVAEKAPAARAGVVAQRAIVATGTTSTFNALCMHL